MLRRSTQNSGRYRRFLARSGGLVLSLRRGCAVPYRSHIILFRYRAYTLEVVNVLHASRDFDAYFAEPDDDDN
jgi:plasmid stabilization system protein ParE